MECRTHLTEEVSMPAIVEFPHVVHAIDDMLIDHEGIGNVLWHSRSANSNLDNDARADDRDPADAGDDGSDRWP